MRAVAYDTATPHEAGEFCRRITCENYFFSYFETPYIYEREGQLVAGNPGDMLIVEPGVPVYHGYSRDELFGNFAQDTGGFVNDWIYLYGGEIREMLERYPLPLNTAFPVDESRLLSTYIRRIRREETVRSVGWEDKLKCLTLDLIIDLHRIHRRIRVEDSARARLESVREQVMQRPEKNWTLEEMAALSGYSVSRFCTLYREHYGCAPVQDLLNVRIDLAARLLQYTNIPVAEVAVNCGFQSIYYFSKYFKQCKGCSPRQYRKGNVP